MNPNFNYGQIMPGQNGNRGNDQGLIDCRFLSPTFITLEIVLDSGVLNGSEAAAVVKWCADFMEWMETSSIGKANGRIGNNIGTFHDLLLIGLALLGEREDVARSLMQSYAQRRVWKQVEPDGRQPDELGRTRTLHYSLFNLQHTFDICVRSKDKGIDIYTATSADGRSVRKATEWLSQWVGRPQSAFPHKEIGSWAESEQGVVWLLKEASDQFERNSTYLNLFDANVNTTAADPSWLLNGYLMS
jgi:hypothetical protein